MFFSNDWPQFLRKMDTSDRSYKTENGKFMKYERVLSVFSFCLKLSSAVWNLRVVAFTSPLWSFFFFFAPVIMLHSHSVLEVFSFQIFFFQFKIPCNFPKQKCVHWKSDVFLWCFERAIMSKPVEEIFRNNKIFNIISTDPYFFLWIWII